MPAALLIEGVVDRGVWMTERGAVSNNDAVVEPREAQRPTSLAARTPTAAIPGNGDIAVGALADREVRPAGHVSLLYKGAVAQLPGAVASRVYPTCALNRTDLG